MIHNRIRFVAVILLVLVGLGGAMAGPAEPSELPMAEVHPEPTDAVLLNPGMGLYLACGRTLQAIPEDAWFRDIADIAYCRMEWARVEPNSGFDLGDYFDPIFDYWVKERGGRVAFRVMAESMHSDYKYVTPEWVFERGAPGVKHIGLRDNEQIDPVFWDERYLDEACAFVKRMGRELDGRPGLEFVDIGLIGEWGEMHLGMHHPNRWTGEQLEETGYTEEKYIAAYRRIIDAFAVAFPNTQVYLNVGDYQAINEYAAIKGIHFRQDGLTPSGPSHNVGERYYKPWSRRGIKGNYEFHSGLNSMREKGWDLHEAIEKGLEAPISYLNTNILGVSSLLRAPEEVREELRFAGRRVGFRFVPVRFRYLEAFHVSPSRPGRILVEHEWTNDGVAPCYKSYALQFSLLDASGKTVHEYIHYPRIPTTAWWPGESVNLRAVVRTPEGLPPGAYLLKVKMFLPENPEEEVRLGLVGGDELNRYTIGKVTAVAGVEGPEAVYRQGFEDGPGRWSAARGINLSIDDGAPHSGEGCLRLRGEQEGAWNFAAVTLQSPILPASKYRLEAWLRVDAFEPALGDVTVKLGVSDADGRWLANYNTTQYDMMNAGTWQRLIAVFETGVDSARGTISIEKGGRHRVRDVLLRLDDVRLDLLERP